MNLLDMSIAASYLVIVIAIFRLIFKKVPKFINCAMWAFVGIRLILPFSINSIISLFPNTEPVVQDVVYLGQQASIKTSEFVEKTVSSISIKTAFVASQSNVDFVNMVAGILFTVWVAGVVAMFLYSVITYLHIHSKVKVSVRLRDNIYLCDYVDSPFILGIFKPKIYIPADLTEQEMKCVILHETAHIVRRDNWWKLLGFLLLMVYWFNPILWCAYLMLCRDIEFACDEKIIKNMGNAERQTYSQVLLTYSIPRYMVVAYPVAFGEVGVKMRIKSILNYKKPTFWAIVATVVICIGVGAAFLFNPISLKAFEDLNDKYDRYEDYSADRKFEYKDKESGIVYTIILAGDDLEKPNREFVIKTNNSNIQEITGTYQLLRNVLYLHTYDPGNNKICYVFNKDGFKLTFDKEKSPYAPILTGNDDEVFEKAVFEQTDIQWIYY